MAKAGLLFVGTDDGLVLFSDPGAAGRWLRVGHELRGQPISALWPLAHNPLVVLAGGPGGLWRSTDGGASWQPALDTGVAQLAGNKDTPQTLDLLAASGQALRSEDGGATWAAGPAPLAALGQQAAAELAGREPVRLAALPAGGIGRSVDQGATYAPSDSDSPWAAPVSVIAAAPYHIDTAFAGSAAGQVAISVDRGRTWRMIKQDLPPVRAIAAARLV